MAGRFPLTPLHICAIFCVVNNNYPGYDEKMAKTKSFHVWLTDDARAVLERLKPLAKQERRSLAQMLIVAAEKGAEQIEREQAA